jgi:hypothetical protein
MSSEWYGITAVFVLVAGIGLNLSENLQKLRELIEQQRSELRDIAQAAKTYEKLHRGELEHLEKSRFFEEAGLNNLKALHDAGALDALSKQSKKQE